MRREHVFSKTLRVIALSASAGLIAGLLSFPGAAPDPAFASTPTDSCRAGQAADRTTNGKHEITVGSAKLTIEPVFANRMYADLGNGYDAMYIAYRITSTTTRNDVWITLDGWTAKDGATPVAPVVGLARARDDSQRIGTLSADTPVTKYFLVKASGYSEDDQLHNVRISTGARPGENEVTACQTAIEGVQRSISSRANRVTEVTPTAPVLGSTMTITVKGTTGNIGNGSSFDGSAMTLSPTSMSAWPTQALQLTGVSISVVTRNNLVNNTNTANSNCLNNTGVSGTGNTRTVSFSDRLILRKIGSCTTSQSTYTVVYTFKVTSALLSNPEITPVADIASGAQMKYTGGYSAGSTFVEFVDEDGTSTAVPDDVKKTTVTKSYAGGTTPPTVVTDGSDSFVDLEYKINAASTGGKITLDEVWDYLPPGGVVQSAKIGSANRAFVHEETPKGSLVRFFGPLATDFLLEYTVRVPVKAGTNTFPNSAYGLFGTYVIGSGSNTITTITLTLEATADGDTITVASAPGEVVTTSGLPQEIAFNAPTGLAEGQSAVLTATSDSGLPVTFSVSDDSTCVVDFFNGVWTVTMAGQTCVVIASQDPPSGSGFAPAEPVERVIGAFASQVIEPVATPATLAGSGSTAQLTISATSGLPVTVSELSGECTLTTNGPNQWVATATVSNGACIISATQGGGVGAGGVQYAAAEDVTFAIPIGTKTQSLNFVSFTQTNAVVSKVADGEGPAEIFATENGATNGKAITEVFVFIESRDQDGKDTTLTVSLTSKTPAVCSIGVTLAEGEIVSDYKSANARTEVKVVRNQAGTCTVEANQDGFRDDGTSAFPPASPKTLSFIFLAKGQTPQTISFPDPNTLSQNNGVDAVYGATLTIQATSQTGESAEPTNLLVVFSVTGDCLVGTTTLENGNTLTTIRLTGMSDCVITASQAGNDDFQPATRVTRTLAPGKRAVTVTGLSGVSREYDGTTLAQVDTSAPQFTGLAPGDTAAAIGASFSGATWNFDDANVGDARPITGSGVTLTGPKKDNYELALGTITPANITPKAVTITPNNVESETGVTPPVNCGFSHTGLAAGEEFDPDSVECAYGTTSTPFDKDVAGDYDICIEGCGQAPAKLVIRQTGGVTTTTANYTITAGVGVITVISDPLVLDPTTLTGITIVYGEDIPDTWFDEPQAKKGTNSANGSVSHRVNKPGAEVDNKDPRNTRLPAGSITVMVEFEEDGTGRKITGSRTITVNARPLSYQVTINNKVYDGTTETTLGSFTLTGTEDAQSGVVPGDEADLVFLNPPTTGSFTSADVGDDQDVSFSSPGLTGAKAGNYTLVPRGQGRANITPRPLTYSFVPPSKVYDGTSSVPLGAFTLAAIAGNSDSGVVGDDDVEFDTTPSGGSLASANVGTHSLSWTGPTLGGAKAGNYQLSSPSGVQGTITKRPVTFTVQDYARFVDDDDPTDWPISETPSGDGVGIAPGQTRASVLGSGFTVTKGTKTVVPGGLDFIPLTIDAPNPNGNYSITKVSGRLFLSSVTFTLQTEPDTGVVTSREVVCDCEGFDPGSVATIEIRSTPTLLRNITIDADGNCPLTTVTIPDSVTDGNHTLALMATFPTGVATEQTRAVTLSTPVAVSAPGSDPTPTTPTTPSPSSPSRGTTTSPLVVPIVPGPLASPPPGFGTSPTPLSPNLALPTTPPQAPNQGDPQAPNGLGETGSTNGPGRGGQSPLATLVERSQAPENTFDLGVEGLGPAELVGNGSTSRAGTRTVGEIREERLGGFDPGTALRVEVIGSRTTARFVISTLTGLDELVLIEQITRSSAGNRTDFAGVDRVGIGSPTGPQDPWGLDERDSAYDLFNYSRLDVPTKQSDLLGSSSYTWLNIEKGVKGYLPGSTVYLTATSSPVVFGETQVGPDGQAIVNGDLAVELLGLGEHRIRVIGTRVFQDVQVDSDGEVIIPDFVLEQILLFDMGTDATVIVTGNNPTGGVHTVMRVVPLDPVSPWWTLWVIAWTALLLLLARMRGMIGTFIEKSVAGGAVLVSSIPALYLGWTTTVTQVAWWGLLMGLGLSLAVWFVPSLRRREEAVA